MKKIVVTIADENNMPLANNMINSLRKFHSEEELPVHIVTGDELKAYLEEDPHFFYRATPILGQKFLKDYDLVLKLDADQIIFGDLSYIWEHDYDVGTVLNINRVDPQKYGLVNVHPISPQQYFNCGLVAMKNKDFVNKWHELCYSEFFGRLQYREQDLLNLACYFGDWNVKCFDRYDPVHEYSAWHGLVAKGETVRAELTDNGDVVIHPDESNYPDKDIVLKVFHYAGGGHEERNYRIWFNEELQKHIEWLIADE